MGLVLDKLTVIYLQYTTQPIAVCVPLQQRPVVIKFKFGHAFYPIRMYQRIFTRDLLKSLKDDAILQF